MVDLAREFVRLGHTVEFVLMHARGDFLSEAQRYFSVYDLATPRARTVLPDVARYLRQHRAIAFGLDVG